MDQQDRIFVGTLLFTTDNFLLAPPDLSGAHPFIDVDFTFFDETLNHQQVSILGHMGERAITEFTSVPSLIAKKVVVQRDIAVRAYHIWESGSGGSDLDNWLRAERELIEEEPLRTPSAGSGK